MKETDFDINWAYFNWKGFSKTTPAYSKQIFISLFEGIIKKVLRKLLVSLSKEFSFSIALTSK